MVPADLNLLQSFRGLGVLFAENMANVDRVRCFQTPLSLDHEYWTINLEAEDSKATYLPLGC